MAALVAAFRRGGRRAAADGDALLVRDLLAHGWAPAQDRDRRGASAAHVAAGRGAVAVLGELIASDAALARDRDAAGATPLHWAACGVRGNAAGTGFEEPAAELLLASPAPTRARDARGRWERRHSLGGVAGGRRGRADAARGRRGRARRQRPRVHLRALGGGRRRHRYLGLSARRLPRRPPAGRTPRATRRSSTRAPTNGPTSPWLVSVDPRAVEYALRSRRDADDANLSAIAGMACRISKGDLSNRPHREIQADGQRRASFHGAAVIWKFVSANGSRVLQYPRAQCAVAQRLVE